MIVKAAPGTQCPREDNPRTYIGAEPVEVPDTAYYRRLVADGSLILEESDPSQGSSPKGGTRK